MPTPSIIVTFVDADGDQFPVRIWGEPGDFDRITLREAARRELDKLKEVGRWQPRYPVSTPLDLNPELRS